MKNSFLAFAALFASCFIALSGVYADEPWELSPPGGADIRQGAFARQEHLELHVPESFEGRTAIERRTTVGGEISNRVRYSHTESDVELRGTATVFDFEYSQDVLDIQIFRSEQTHPGGNSCMDCHGGQAKRTTAIIGIEKQDLDPHPYRRGGATIYLDPAESTSYRGEINHWLSPRLMAKAEYRIGRLKQGRHSLDANSATIGVAGTAWHRLTWTGDLNFSKVESYKQRKTLIGKISYRIFRGLKLSAGGGAFLDGYTQFSTEMSEMGLMTTGLEKDDPALLPTLFNRLKDDQFGYWHFGAEYEHKF
ncbi:MAG: hypothetical protein EOM80_16475 [Erysipelotrichia bacterium]|nr:hypothetical protein [Erysipelotrichia bacterium]